MHPNNPYHNNPPDFVTLAEQYPSLRPYVVLNIKGDRTRGSLNFRDPMALRELTYCLLHRDFSIKLDIPINSLCPAIPNRVNYICWIEDLMRNETESVIHGIDIGTGASCIYPLLGCTRNKNWRIMATDINDRSLQFAAKNVIMNNLQDTIVLLKSHPKKIFPGMLFQESEKIYDFCMCNPPFYEDEQDIQESHDSKEGLPSAVCLGMPNEMITAGGETQFVQRMIDESCIWRTRIRWYTSMLGKKTSVDKVVAYLKENNIFNITFTTFRQGRTTRWAVGWSFGDERASMKSMQQASKKMAKLSSTATVLSFTALNITIEEAVARRLK
ncbi:ribosomal RNA large subunit methyltransferase F-like protein [Lobosporangium transversale]|uniref:U6 small nuclear RNA (adenine-(43)-N(6))-methyltransferase n=1 Tax=Lobosporangium transversale TaxID=64571 RepID=A0A1Y2GH82_9FUNG|nr:ribosomal RNA large subunit methyltransferase F-like protein [Lobosporangium transversale]ORZ09676.1 ribosomal RNA large subunit methyltransferase F-like protein [Lobosporangium transversale]|eukprot:XP_021878946.1 ribosomal RNA large subunit methyltransferase F-like protein [Lobosporangium transversale]